MQKNDSFFKRLNYLFFGEEKPKQTYKDFEIELIKKYNNCPVIPCSGIKEPAPQVNYYSGKFNQNTNN